jgi:UDP-N-acetyl-D-galactosamine dehydrogenase
MIHEKIRLGIIGLGYVGLPLAVEFSKKVSVVGFDVNHHRISELKLGVDSTLEVTVDELADATNIHYSSSENDLKPCNVYIVTVPTPVDKYKQPDLGALIRASEMIGRVIELDDVIVYESTVYPGATEEECMPVVERVSGLKFNRDFFCGYSPERINPGDRNHRVTDILKITSGSNAEIAEFIDSLYASIITAGTYKAGSIKVAEAAKVIENTQRDVNIALINELSIIFNKLEIDTLEVLEAAETKWNFLSFRPGLVGGHCIGVDPYYLTHKAQSVGYVPEIILAGRRLNDGMSSYIVSRLVKKMISEGMPVEGSNILIMGFTFKENCPDIRNTKVHDIVVELSNYNISIDVFDPWSVPEDAVREYGINIVESCNENHYDAIIIAVGHDEFKRLGIDYIRKLGKAKHLIYDLKYVLQKQDVDLRL